MRRYSSSLLRLLPVCLIRAAWGRAAGAILLLVLTQLQLPLAMAGNELEVKVVDNLSSELGIPVYSWASRRQEETEAVIVAIHGATLHARSYTTISRQLANEGYAVFAADMRGFGSWYKGHDDPEDASRRILYRPSEADLRSLLSKLRQLYPNKPIFLMGESVGANMAIRLLAADGNCADGMILSSPGIKQRFFIGPTVIMQFLTVMIKPGSQLSVSPILRSRISDDPRITSERVNDPLARNKMNVGELFKTRWFNKESLKLLPQIPERIPVLVLEGTDDKLFDSHDIEKLMAQLNSNDKTLHWLQGKGHIHLETVYLKPEVIGVINDWLKEKTLKLSRQPVAETKVSTVSGTYDRIP